ncbi:DUF6640 family protein [Sorangium sp. So ce1097]|uniref:DUF6640 family protein n=1 Tax=Sorangium sp. So ce1097 TaxID=3133330 RepID=UPI003F613A34
MNRSTLGRVVLTFVLVSGAIVAVGVDWNETHLFNPAWHEHARFHGALMLLILCGVTVVGLWMVWRRSMEPQVGFNVAAWIVVIIWTPFFYITWLIPGTSLLAGPDVPLPVVAGVPLYPNVLIAGAELLLAALAYKLFHSDPASTAARVANA